MNARDLVWFDKLKYRDFQNGAVVTEIRNIVKEHAALKVQVETSNLKERELRNALLEFVRVENNFGHTGQHEGEKCADCKRVKVANAALSHGHLL